MFDCMFFGRRCDLIAIATELQRPGVLFAIEAGLKDERERPIIEGLLNLPGFQENAPLKHLLQPYLLSGSQDFIIEEISQRRGGIKYDADLKGNPAAWYLVVGGEVQEGVLVPGRIYGSPTGIGRSLTATFQTATARYIKEGPFLVSPEAHRLARNGGRLVANSNPDSPREYDLVI